MQHSAPAPTVVCCPPPPFPTLSQPLLVSPFQTKSHTHTPPLLGGPCAVMGDQTALLVSKNRVNQGWFCLQKSLKKGLPGRLLGSLNPSGSILLLWARGGMEGLELRRVLVSCACGSVVVTLPLYPHSLQTDLSLSACTSSGHPLRHSFNKYLLNPQPKPGAVVDPNVTCLYLLGEMKGTDFY